jgi:hypothetical protein
MQLKRRASDVLMVMLVLAGCSSNKYTGGRLSRPVGSASALDAVTQSLRLLNLSQYEIERQEQTPSQVVIETRWRKRPPFADEAVLGAQEAENRITVMGRFRTQTPTGPLYGFEVQIENRMLMTGGTDWVDTTATPMYRNYAEGIATELRKQFTLIGVRVF